MRELSQLLRGAVAPSVAKQRRRVCELLLELGYSLRVGCHSSAPDLNVELADLDVVHDLDLDVEAAMEVDKCEHEVEPGTR